MLRYATGLLVLAAAALVLSGCGGGADAAIQEASIRIHYSAFGPEELEVQAGEPVVITLQNDDPILHEWIVGSEEVHQRHRTGAEPYHDQIPTEVSIPALSVRKTMLTFAEPGVYRFICHLPGHEAYGMVGTLRVVE